jgi:hypothetical protein
MALGFSRTLLPYRARMLYLHNAVLYCRAHTNMYQQSKSLAAAYRGSQIERAS